MKCDCRGCENRSIGCHGKCEKYAEFRARMERIKEQQAAESAANDATARAITRAVGKYKWNTRK